MDRSFIYSNQIARSFDEIWQRRDIAYAIGWLMQSFFGSSDTFVDGFVATETLVPSLTINMTEGRLYGLAEMDSTSMGALSADTTLIMQQGHKAAHTITLSTAGLTAGQSRWALIEAKFLQDDEIRAGDPSAGVFFYFNADDPTQPFEGPADSGSDQPSVRRGAVTIQTTYGAAASTGSQVAPSPSSGFVPLYLILLTNGQTTITNGNILKAGPEVGVGVDDEYPEAPFNTGLYGHHHVGTGGSAPKVSLTQEVDGILPLPNLPVTNDDPPASAKIPIIGHGSGTPQGARAGEVDDLYWDTASKTLWLCITAGNSSTSAWEPVGVPEKIDSTSSSVSLTGRLHKIYLMRPTANATISLDAVADMLGSVLWIKNDLALGSAYTVTIDGDDSELVDGNSSMVLYPQQSCVLVPRVISGTGSWSNIAGPSGMPFGGNGGRQLPTSGALSGYYYHSGNWTSTGTLTAAPGTKIKVAGNISLGHTLTLLPGITGGVGCVDGKSAPAPGGGPGGGYALLTGSDRMAGGGGGNGGRGGNGGSSTAGVYAPGGKAYSIDEYFMGSSGGGGSSASTKDGGDGGDAGGSLYVECSGTFTSTVNIAGSGGNGADGETNDGAGGAGGSGGTIEIRAGVDINITGGSITLDGGDGGSGGGTGGGHGGKGPGGGGGNCRLWAGNAVTGGGNVSVLGGSKGATGSSSQDAEDGEAGVYEEIEGVRPSSRF